MEGRMIKYKLIVLVLMVMVATSCYYDNEEYLYPGLNDCNTEQVEFSQQIMPLFNNNCTACHSGAAAGAGIGLTNHADIVEAVNGGRLMGAIRHDAGFSAMPKAAPKLDDCSISLVESWIADGMPNN